MSRLLKKRELLTYYYLWKRYGNDKVKIDTLKKDIEIRLGYSQKVARSILKRLIKIGVLDVRSDGYVLIRSFDSYFDSITILYLDKRMRRHGS